MHRIRHFLVAPAVFLLLWAPVAGQETGARKGILETDEAQVFLEAFRAISRFHSSALGDSALWERALEGLIEQLDDPYATVFTPAEYDQFREQTTGNYAGIGVQIGRLGARVTVTAVFRGAPAHGAGMLVGDRIVWVEGHDATDWTLDQARDSIRGVPGTVVRIRVVRDGIQDPIPLDIVRDSVHVSAMEATYIEEGVAHIAIDRIARGVAGELAEALVEYDDAHSLIMDLRRNPGGYLDEALQLVDLLLAPGQTLASAEGINAWGEVERQSWPARSPPLLTDKPFIILVDEFSASAAEIIAGALQDYDRAVVVGQRTFGKGVVQTVYPLPAGRQIRITTGSWFTPLGRSLHRARHRDGTPVAETGAEAERVATASGRTASHRRWDLPGPRSGGGRAEGGGVGAAERRQPGAAAAQRPDRRVRLRTRQGRDRSRTGRPSSRRRPSTISCAVWSRMGWIPKSSATRWPEPTSTGGLRSATSTGPMREVSPSWSSPSATPSWPRRCDWHAPRAHPGSSLPWWVTGPRGRPGGSSHRWARTVHGANRD